MKYTEEEAFEEVMKRGRRIRIRRRKIAMTVMSVFTGILSVALILAIGSFGGVGVGIEANNTYGSFLLPTQAGGYVLVAVLAFAVGVGVTLIIQKYREKRPDNDNPV